MNHKIFTSFVVIIILMVLVISCGPSPEEVEATAVALTAAAATDTPTPTNTPLPTDTPTPTDTPSATPIPPTDTPTPTDTPVPTDTPTPTNTSTPTPVPTDTPTQTPTPTDTPEPTPVPTNTPIPFTPTPPAPSVNIPISDPALRLIVSETIRQAAPLGGDKGGLILINCYDVPVDWYIEQPIDQKRLITKIPAYHDGHCSVSHLEGLYSNLTYQFAFAAEGLHGAARTGSVNIPAGHVGILNFRAPFSMVQLLGSLEELQAGLSSP